GPDGILDELRDEVRCPALHEMRAEERMAFRWRAVGAACLPDATAQNRRIVRLANNNLRFRSFLLQHPCNALERAARAHARNPIAEAASFEILENFDRCCPDPRNLPKKWIESIP